MVEQESHTSFTFIVELCYKLHGIKWPNDLVAFSQELQGVALQVCYPIDAIIALCKGLVFDKVRLSWLFYTILNNLFLCQVVPFCWEFLFLEPPGSSGLSVTEMVFSLCSSLGVPLAMYKIEGPLTCLCSWVSWWTPSGGNYNCLMTNYCSCQSWFRPCLTSLLVKEGSWNPFQAIFHTQQLSSNRVVHFSLTYYSCCQWLDSHNYFVWLMRGAKANNLWWLYFLKKWNGDPFFHRASHWSTCTQMHLGHLDAAAICWLGIGSSLPGHVICTGFGIDSCGGYCHALGWQLAWEAGLLPLT